MSIPSTLALNWSPLSEAEIRHTLFGCISVESTPDGLIPWRLRHRDRAFIDTALLPRLTCTSGVRLQLRTRAAAIRLTVTPLAIVPGFAGNGANFDLFINGAYTRTAVIPEQGRGEVLFSQLPEGEKELTIYFPLHLQVTIHLVELAGASTLAPIPVRPRWITHGSSITHCRASASPGYSWPAIVARQKGWDFWNMGYGGECRFDQVVARAIRDTHADFISLCLGINTADHSYSLRTWRPAVEGFIMTIRDGHPETPLLIISPIYNRPREDQNASPCLIALNSMRRVLEEVVHTFRAAGDTNIHYLNGLNIIGADDAGTMPDELHPDAEGIKLMAERFLAHAPKAWSGV